MGIFFTCSEARAEEYQPGFRTLGNWLVEPEMRLDLNIWYPASRSPKTLSFSPWLIEGALNAKPAPGKFPMLVLSHSTAGTRFSHHDLAAILARSGFVVVAPTHGHDSMYNMDDLFTWSQLERRVREIRETIEIVLAEKDFSDMVDSSRLGMIGFGSGATVALLLGGAVPSCEYWEEYCAHAGGNDVYCNTWARERIDALCRNFPLKHSMADPRIHAIAAIAPGFGMVFGKESFYHFSPPLLLVAAAKDKFNLPRLHCEPIARLLGKKAKYLNLPAADTGALMSACPPGFENELPELCRSITPEGRRQLLNTLSGALISFFSANLGGAQSSSAPTPPDSAPSRP